MAVSVGGLRRLAGPRFNRREGSVVIPVPLNVSACHYHAPIEYACECVCGHARLDSTEAM